jgi:DNA modification methylase
MGVDVIAGDCLIELRKMPESIVQLCVTSPPYYGLRDYGVTRQIGLEFSLDLYIKKLVEVFREVRRVLRNDGLLHAYPVKAHRS